MAAVKITINGVICDMYGRTISGPVKIVGEAMYSDLGVGGGPMPPQGPVDPGYGVPEGHPEHPIYRPPVDPGFGNPAFDPRPSHPIYYPPPGEPPTGTPDDDGFVKPPPADGGWAYHQTYGWMYDPPPGAAQPKG